MQKRINSDQNLKYTQEFLEWTQDPIVQIIVLGGWFIVDGPLIPEDQK